MARRVYLTADRDAVVVEVEETRRTIVLDKRGSFWRGGDKRVTIVVISAGNSAIFEENCDGW